MKKILANFADAVLSKEQLKNVKGGYDFKLYDPDGSYGIGGGGSCGVCASNTRISCMEMTIDPMTIPIPKPPGGHPITECMCIDTGTANCTYLA